METRTCIQCGTIFTKTFRNNKKYCSNKCSQKYRNELKKKTWGGGQMEKENAIETLRNKIKTATQTPKTKTLSEHVQELKETAELGNNELLEVLQEEYNSMNASETQEIATSKMKTETDAWEKVEGLIKNGEAASKLSSFEKSIVKIIISLNKRLERVEKKDV